MLGLRIRRSGNLEIEMLFVFELLLKGNNGGLELLNSLFERAY